MRWLKLLMAVGMIGIAGCNEAEDGTEETDGINDDGGAIGADQATWDAIEWLTSSGPACPGATQVMELGAVLNGDKGVSFSYDGYPWSGSGLAHFFVWQGDHFKGGKFDWIHEGGQGYKEFENIEIGYNGHEIPASGTTVAFAWTNADGTERSNLVILTWP